MDSLISKVQDYLDSKEFYELAQNYRHAPKLFQAQVFEAYDELKQGIIKAIARSNKDVMTNLASMTSAAKTKASRENGKLGGRPKKK